MELNDYLPMFEAEIPGAVDMTFFPLFVCQDEHGFFVFDYAKEEVVERANTEEEALNIAAAYSEK